MTIYLEYITYISKIFHYFITYQKNIKCLLKHTKNGLPKNAMIISSEATQLNLLVFILTQQSFQFTWEHVFDLFQIISNFEIEL